MQTPPALPKIEVIQVGKRFEVHWDYQEAPESIVLFEQRERLEAFINGALIALDIPAEQVSCAGSTAGAVKKLEDRVAQRLAEILSNLLHPLVLGEYQRQQNNKRLPHVKNTTETELSAGTNTKT